MMKFGNYLSDNIVVNWCAISTGESRRKSCLMRGTWFEGESKGGDALILWLCIWKHYKKKAGKIILVLLIIKVKDISILWLKYIWNLLQLFQWKYEMYSTFVDFEQNRRNDIRSILEFQHQNLFEIFTLKNGNDTSLNSLNFTCIICSISWLDDESVQIQNEHELDFLPQNESVEYNWRLCEISKCD